MTMLTRYLPRALVVASIAWPLALGASVWARAHGAWPGATEVVYAACSRVCHQMSARSFFTAGVQWPVCGRCAGLYLAAPFGALLAFVRRRPAADARMNLRVLALLALPTAATIVLEWGRLAPVGNLTRAIAALPLGAALAFIVVREAGGEARSTRAGGR